MSKPAKTTDWARNALIYGLDVASFADGDGDGIGDFRGLSRRLGYIRGLGFNCLWLMPFYRSPDRDNGYDVSDHTDIDPRFGVLADFNAFLRQAHRHGLRVIIDIVANHTSSEHEWFQRSRDPGSPYHAYYHWQRKPPPRRHHRKHVVPTQGDTEVWTYDRRAKEYYFHRYYDHQPDLDHGCQELVEEYSKIIRFWARRGVDGMRLDSLVHLFERKGDHPAPDRKKVLSQWRRALHAEAPHAVFLGESDVEPQDYAKEFGASADRVDLLLNFYLSSSLFLALGRKDARAVRRVFDRLGKRPGNTQWVNFLRNLDELDLERLTAAEQREAFRIFAPKRTMRAYGRGIRRRVAPMLQDARRLRMAWSLLMSLPGAPLVAYGDELAMGEDLRRQERHAVRLPMPWTSRVQAGSMICWQSRAHRPRRPTLMGAQRKINVEAQEADPQSFLHWFRALMAVRRSLPEIATGRFRFLTAKQESLSAVEYAARRPIRMYHNLNQRPIRVRLPGRWRTFWNSAGSELREHMLELPGYGYGWLRRD